MQVSLKDFDLKKEIKQLISYFCVGGSAAIVEWLVFAISANAIGMNYLIATCVAFIFSTTTNWVLGRLWTFRNRKAYKSKAVIEGALVFLVSGIGLAFNLGLMYLFVTVIKMNTPIQKVVSKIIATGIVFFWNYLARKLFVYRSNF